MIGWRVTTFYGLLSLVGDTELLKFLLSRGVNVDSQSVAGTPLLWAAGHVQQDAVKVLLEQHADVVRCLLIEPFPESALNEQVGKMLLENYAEYARHARLYIGIHALKQKPKFKTGAISESTTALNVEMERLGLLCKPVNGEDMTSVADTAGDMATTEGGLEQGRVHTLIFLDQLLGVQLVLRLLEITKLLLKMSVTLGV